MLLLTKQRRIDSVSAVPRRTAVTYLVVLLENEFPVDLAGFQRMAGLQSGTTAKDLAYS
jgi:hypothetical protein